MMTETNGLDKLAAALVKAQAQMKAAKKDSENPFFKSDYADLKAVWEACHEALKDNGLAVSQTMAYHDGHSFLRTHLLHTSGQVLSGEYLIKPVKDDPQGYGSAVTYARRYSLAAICGVVTTESDDDGEAAMGNRVAPKVAEKVDAKVSPAVSKVFAKSEPKIEAKTEAADGEVEFIPATVSKKDGEKGGKAWVKYGVKHPDGRWFGTFDSTRGQMAEHAMKSNTPCIIGFKSDGKFLTITSIKLAATSTVNSEEVIEKVPF